MRMKKRAVAFVALTNLIGLIGIALCCRQVWLEGRLAHVSVLVSMLILCTLCRSFPIYMRADQVIDVSILSMVAICLYEGPAMAVVMYAASSFFFRRSQRRGWKGLYHLQYAPVQDHL